MTREESASIRFNIITASIYPTRDNDPHSIIDPCLPGASGGWADDIAICRGPPPSHPSRRRLLIPSPSRHGRRPPQLLPQSWLPLTVTGGPVAIIPPSALRRTNERGSVISNRHYTRPTDRPFLRVRVPLFTAHVCTHLGRTDKWTDRWIRRWIDR